MTFKRKYNTLTVTGTTAIRIPIIKRAVVDFAVGADWTPAAGDVKIAIDGASAANVTNLPTAVAMGNTAYWQFILTAAELTCKSCVVTVADSATKAVEDQAFIVETFGHASAMYQADFSLDNLPANVTQLLGTAWLTPGTAGTPDVNTKLAGGTAWGSGAITAASIAADAITAAKIADGAIDAATFAAGAIDAAAIAEDAIGASELAADAVSEIQFGLASSLSLGSVATDVEDVQARQPAALVGGRMDSDATAINGSATAAANLGTLYAAIETGTAQAGGASTITLRAGASAVDNLFKDQAIFITGGTGAGQTNRITAYNGTTKICSTGTAWVTQPDNTSIYECLGRIG